MAVTGCQAEIPRRIARLRIDGGETYIKSSERDCRILREAGCELTILRDLEYMVG